MRKAGLSSFWLLVLLVVVTCYEDYEKTNKLRTVFSWKALDFAFGSDIAREAAIRTGRFKPGASIPIDVDVYYGAGESMVFIAMPRLEQGIPVTVGYVTELMSKDGNPLIAPYPDWEWNRLGDCDAITSTYRVQIDDCGRLWILDTGVIGDRRVCRPQLLSFSLKTNKLLSRHRFPRDQFKEHSLFVTPVVDVRTIDAKCRDTFVYIADVTGFSLVVYDHMNARSWRINNNLFYPYPPHGTFNIGNEVFDLMDGLLGMALSPIRPDGDRTLYFHSLASTTESYVPTSVIRNFTLFEKNPDASPRSFKAFPMERPSQSAAESMDRDGVLFFGLMTDLAIACWNSKHYPEFGGRNIEKLVVNEDTLQFPSGLKVVTGDMGRQEVWVSTAAFQRYMSGTLHPNETNFRIQAGYVDELVRGTKCDVNALDIYNQHTGRLPSPTR
ncbi:yellow-e3 isoform X1 [Nasonia vitripennis]|uniref:Bee-milk protein n=1 Tax=Nasonia vitripennis TaxID=7425 RepID=A0A7M7H977_NASVI|nr:yellow-e3 precursor [Nasonia vitripennis]XP_008210279.1 yellow-e3 isoform X1 [Nasonia vitripennis]XP_008210280.1 yellow-e3 isoform X1 [Nasonia vitripennis]